MPVNYPPIYHTISGNTAGVPALILTGTLTLAGGPNITLSQAGNAISFSAAAVPAAGAGTGFTSGTTGGVDVKGTLGTDGLSLRVPAYLTTAQPVGAYLTTARASNDAIGLNSALTANGVSVTANSAGLSLNFPAFLTTAAASNHSHGNPTLALTNLTGTTASNSAGLTLSLSAAAPGAGNAVSVSDAATSGTIGRLAFTNLNGVTLSLSTGADGSHTIVGSHNALTTARASNDAIGLNSALTANGVSMTANSAGLSLNFPAFLTTAAASNHSHGNPTLALTNLSGTTASASNGLTLSLSAANPGGGAGVTMSEWCPYPEMSLLSASALGQNSLYFNPVDVPEALNAYRANFFLSVAPVWNAAGNNTRSAGYTLSFCLYSRGTGASTERLMSLLSRSAYLSMAGSSVSRVSVTHPLGISDSTAVSTTTYASADANASTYIVNSLGGYRVLVFPISSTLTAGRYWMAVANSSVSSHASAVLNCSVVQQLHGSNIAYMPFGTSSKASNASWPQVFAGRGVYSAASAAFPVSVALSTDHIRQLATTVVLPFFNVSGYTTATNIP